MPTAKDDDWSPKPRTSAEHSLACSLMQLVAHQNYRSHFALPYIFLHVTISSPELGTWVLADETRTTHDIHPDWNPKVRSIYLLGTPDTILSQNPKQYKLNGNLSATNNNSKHEIFLRYSSLSSSRPCFFGRRAGRTRKQGNGANGWTGTGWVQLPVPRLLLS